MSDQDTPVTEATGPQSYEEWLEAHSEIFVDYGFDHQILGRLLYEKLMTKQMDAGRYFAIDTQVDPTLIYIGKTPLTPLSNVFISDHCWVANPAAVHAVWKENEELRERLSSFCTSVDATAVELSLEERLATCDGKNLDLDDLDIENVVDLKIEERFPGLESLSLWGNKINNPADLLHVVSALPNLRGLWIRGNPVADSPKINDTVMMCCQKLEILNSEFTKGYGEWALKYVAHSTDPMTVTMLDLSDRGITALNPEAFANFKNLSSINLKGNEVDVTKIDVVLKSLRSIHCDNTEGLPKNIIFANGVDRETGDMTLPIPDRIWDHMQPAGPMWGLGDEVALSIHHALDGNSRQMEVRSPESELTYFIFWPIAEIQPMDEVTANMYPRIPFGEIGDLIERKPMKSLKSPFASTVTDKRPIKVYTDIDTFANHLHSDKFQLVATEAEADMYWICFHDTPDFTPIYDNKILYNQIEGEGCLTIKDLLYETVRTYMGDVPWLPETFVLCEPENVARFLARHRELKATGQSAVWVVKAFNRARATYMLATDSASEVLRNASLEPRLAQRYLWNPLLIGGLKFDLRFIVLLKSVKPFELFAYKVFWPRMAPKQWALEDFSDYLRHFTVMNYRAPDRITNKTWVDFVQQFNEENPEHNWDDVLQRIYDVFRDLFICGCQKMVQSPYTKAMYGIDVMLAADMQPVILECNFQPDCHRACDLCPSFVDDCFEVMYTDQPVVNENVVRIPLE